MFSAGLRFLLTNLAIPAALTATGIAVPLFGAMLKLPVIGPWINKVIVTFMGKLFDFGVIEVKDTILAKFEKEATEKYAPQVALLREYQSQESMTEEQEREYEKRLNDLAKSRPDIVNG